MLFVQPGTLWIIRSLLCGYDSCRQNVKTLKWTFSIWSERCLNSLTASIGWQVEAYFLKYCHIWLWWWWSAQVRSCLLLPPCSSVHGISLLSSLSLFISHYMIHQSLCSLLYSQFSSLHSLQKLNKASLPRACWSLWPTLCVNFCVLPLSFIPPLLTHAEPQESSSNICLHSQWTQHLLRAWCHEGMWGIFQACCQSRGPGPLGWGILGRGWWFSRALWHAGYVLNGPNGWADSWPVVATAGQNEA